MFPPRESSMESTPARGTSLYRIQSSLAGAPMRAPAVGSKVSAPDAPLLDADAMGPMLPNASDRLPKHCLVVPERMASPACRYEVKLNGLVIQLTSSTVIVSLDGVGKKSTLPFPSVPGLGPVVVAFC